MTFVAALLLAPQLGGVPGRLPESSSNVRFQTVAQGADATNARAGLFVIDEPVGWANYWQGFHRERAPYLEPGFFNAWRLVAIHTGARAGDGYSVNVLRMDRNIDRALISAVETVPPPGRLTRRTAPSAPWVLLRVERGAFGFDLRLGRVVGGATGAYAPGSSVRIGGATVTFAPGVAAGCDHCDHRGRDGCRCGRGRCDCRG